MNRNHLRRIVALERKFPPPMPDWSHLNVDELHHLKMLLVRRFKEIGLPLPSWMAEALDSETPEERVAARIAVGLSPVPPTFCGRSQLAQEREQIETTARKRAVQSLPNPPDKPSEQFRTSKTIASRQRGIRGKRRPRRASRG
jgi:hypothetical protein